VRRGDRYFEDGHYAQALEQYQRATGLDPEDPDVLNKIASTHLRLVDFFEAETVYDRLIAVGLAASIYVVHAHSFGYCEGELTFERLRVSFTPTRGDDSFVITPETLVAIEPGSTNANAAGYALTGGAAAFVLQDAAGKRKKYTVFSNAFAQGDATSAKQRLADTVKLSRLIERLAAKSLK
jgi:tetratricopeptide (TPR) repeat protein